VVCVHQRGREGSLPCFLVDQCSHRHLFALIDDLLGYTVICARIRITELMAGDDDFSDLQAKSQKGMCSVIVNHCNIANVLLHRVVSAGMAVLQRNSTSSNLGKDGAGRPDASGMFSIPCVHHMNCHCLV